MHRENSACPITFTARDPGRGSGGVNDHEVLDVTKVDNSTDKDPQENGSARGAGRAQRVLCAALANIVGDIDNPEVSHTELHASLLCTDDVPSRSGL